VHMIREALAGEEGSEDTGLDKLADAVSSPTSPRHARKSSGAGMGDAGGFKFGGAPRSS
jgi:hypothetical protein